MSNKLRTFLVILITLYTTQNIFAQVNKDTKIMVHYMPWYQSPPYNGNWGWHWTMNHFNPNNIVDGKREIASHFYPLTGPYDSRDPDILEYHVLLMKLSGIDGVIVDWYGNRDYLDYGVLNESTQALFYTIIMADLKFSICYEDQTIKHMVNNNHISSDKAIEEGQNVMTFMENNWFIEDAYLKSNDKPVLLTFGPQYFHNSSDWESIFSVLDTEPIFITLDNRLSPVAAGAYPWPPMSKASGGRLSFADLIMYLTSFYQKTESWDYLVASAFPGFKDIYEEAGIGDSYGILEPQNGVTFDYTLTTALSKNPDVVQIVTWNDYGEGTIVEPTEEFGYQYLEMIQDAKRESIDTSFAYTSDDLEIPLQIFNLRKNFKNSSGVQMILDNVFDLIIDGNLESAITKIKSLQALQIGNDINLSEMFYMSNCYPNPFNPSTMFQIVVPISAHTNITVYNIKGEKVETILDQNIQNGKHTIRWNAENHTSGLYFITLRTGSFIQTEKVMLMR